MGKVFVDSREAPQVALAVLDFHFAAGDPHNENVAALLQMLRPGNVVITPTSAWQRLLAAAYPGELAVYPREAFQAEEFDADQLRRFCQVLPAGFELRRVRLEEVTQFAADLDPALVYNFRSQEEFITRGVGLNLDLVFPPADRRRGGTRDKRALMQDARKHERPGSGSSVTRTR